MFIICVVWVWALWFWLSALQSRCLVTARPPRTVCMSYSQIGLICSTCRKTVVKPHSGFWMLCFSGPEPRMSRRLRSQHRLSVDRHHWCSSRKLHPEGNDVSAWLYINSQTAEYLSDFDFSAWRFILLTCRQSKLFFKFFIFSPGYC